MKELVLGVEINSHCDKPKKNYRNEDWEPLPAMTTETSH